MSNTFAYIRVSTKLQDKATGKGQKHGRAGDSPDVQWAQAQSYREWAKLPDFGEPPHFQDIVSSKQKPFMARNAVKAMMLHLKRGDHIIFQFYDRIGRSALDTLCAIERLSRMGVTCHLSGENLGIDWNRLNDRILCHGKAMAAEIENYHRSERRKLSHKHQQAVGKWHSIDTPRFGIRIVDREQRTFEIDPIEAAVIELIQEFYERGFGPQALAAMLNRCKFWGKCGGKWDYKTVKVVLDRIEDLQERETMHTRLTERKAMQNEFMERVLSLRRRRTGLQTAETIKRNSASHQLHDSA